MRLDADIAPVQSIANVFGGATLAYLTPTSSGCLLSLMFHVGSRRFVGGKLLTEQREPISQNMVRARMEALACRLSGDPSNVSATKMHLKKASRGLLKAVPRRRPTEQSILSARQLRISTALLNSKLNESLPISRIAIACSVSEGHLRRAFRTCTGLSPRQWRHEKRLQFCRQKLLETDESIAVISRQAGFVAQNHFSRVFRQSTGMSPSEWRRIFRSLNKAGVTSFTWQNFGRAEPNAEVKSHEHRQLIF